MPSRSFAGLLPHHLFLHRQEGILLLARRARRRPSLALGCSWRVIPRTVEACAESICLDMARQHESLFRGLPAGSAVQVIMHIRPSTAMPGWETLRDDLPETRCCAPNARRFVRGCRIRKGAPTRAYGRWRRSSPCGCLSLLRLGPPLPGPRCFLAPRSMPVHA